MDRPLSSLDFIDLVPGEDKYAQIKQRLRKTGYNGPFTLEMLEMGYRLLKVKKDLGI